MAQSADPVALREISAVQVEFAGYPALADVLDPGEAVRKLSDLLAAITAPVVDRGGLVLSQRGAGLMAAWNTPVRAQPDHPLHALDAARAAMRAGQVVGSPMLMVPRGAVVTGEAAMGTVGGRYRRQYSAVGVAVQRVREWCTSAADGELIVCARTLQLAGGASVTADQLFSREPLTGSPPEPYQKE